MGQDFWPVELAFKQSICPAGCPPAHLQFSAPAQALEVEFFQEPQLRVFRDSPEHHPIEFTYDALGAQNGRTR